MKKMKIFSVLFVMSAIALFPQSKTGTTIANFLKIDPSARYSAIGSAGVALSGSVSSMYYNPASLGRLENFDAEFTMNQWIAGISYNYAAAAYSVENLGTFALDVTALNSGDIKVRTVDLPEGTGENFTANDFALGLGYGKLITDRVSVGVHLRYINQSIWHSSLDAFALSFGLQYRFTESGVLFGASLSNYGANAAYNGRDVYVNYDFDPDKYGDNSQLPAELRTESFGLPTLFRIGLAAPVRIGESVALIATAEALHPNDNEESVNVGAECKIMNLISIRAGLRNLGLPDSEGNLVLGAGIAAGVFGNITFRLDYAYADYGRLEQAHRITIGLGY